MVKGLTRETCIDDLEIENEVMGVAKWRIIRKGSSTRQKLQNSKGYAESLEFLPALGLFIFKKKSVTII